MTTDNRTNGQIVAKALVAHCEDHKMPFPRGSVKKIVEALRVAGRLAGEPTEAQVEAAVYAAWAKSREFRGVGGQAEFAPPWEFQQVIRAALVAAQGAAPVQPSNGADEDVLAEVRAERDAALARIAELEQILEHDDVAHDINNLQEQVTHWHMVATTAKDQRDTAEARIAEAAKHTAAVLNRLDEMNNDQISYEVYSELHDLVALGLNEGENDD